MRVYNEGDSPEEQLSDVRQEIRIAKYSRNYIRRRLDICHDETCKLEKEIETLTLDMEQLDQRMLELEGMLIKLGE